MPNKRPQLRRGAGGADDQFSRDTERELELSSTPDRLRVYVAPRSLPRMTEHETVETETVAVQPRVDRRARTVPSLVRRIETSRGRSWQLRDVALIGIPIIVGVCTGFVLAAMARTSGGTSSVSSQRASTPVAP